MLSERKPLPIAKAGNRDNKVPDAAAFKKMLDFKTIEGGDYLLQQLENKLNAMGLVDKFKAVMTEVSDFVDTVRAQTATGSQYWSGDSKQAATSLYETFHANFGEKALRELHTKFAGQEIQFTFAMNGASVLRQLATTKDGQPLDEDATDQINDVFSSFLVKNGMMCKDGVIYYSADGAINEDDASKNRLVAPEEYKTKFSGFSDYVKEKSGVNVVLNDVSATVFPETAASSRGAS